MSKSDPGLILNEASGTRLPLGCPPEISVWTGHLLAFPRITRQAPPQPWMSRARTWGSLEWPSAPRGRWQPGDSLAPSEGRLSGRRGEIGFH